MTPVFVDSVYWIALDLANDQSHERAIQHWTQILKMTPSLVTTSYVIDEVVTFFNSRSLHAKAVQIGRAILNSTVIEVVHVDEPLFFAAWDYFQHHTDKRYSLTDCISFVLMEQRGITTAYTFDRHFTQAGFIVEPG